MSETATRELRVRVAGDASDMGRMVNDVVRYLKAIEQNTADTNRSVQQLGVVSQQSAQHLRALGVDGSKSLASLAKEIGGVVAGFVSIGSAIAIVKQGFDFNAEIQQMQLGLSAIVAANEKVTNAQGEQVTGAAKLAYAQGQVADVFAKLKQDAINTTATMPQLVGAFQQVLGPAMSMGMSLDDARKVTVQLVQTMSALGIPMEQAKSEINAILTGQMNQDTNLKNILHLSNEEVRLWTQKGTLAQELLKRTADFGEAGKQASEIWNGAISNLGDNLQQKVLGPLTSDAFRTATEAVKNINAEAFGSGTSSEAAEWGRIINNSLITALDTASAIARVLMIGAGKFREALNGLQIGAAKLGAAQYRANSVNELVDQIPVKNFAFNGSGDQDKLTTVGKLMLTMAPPDASDEQLIKAAQMGGLGGKALEKFKKSLTQISANASAGEQGEVDSILNGDGELEALVKQAKANAAGMKHQFNKSKPAASPSKVTTSDLFKIGDLSYSDAYETLTAKLAKLTKGSEDYVKVKKELVALEREHAQMMAKAKDVGEYFGPADANGIHMPAPTGQSGRIPGYTPGADAYSREWLRSRNERDRLAKDPLGFDMTLDWDKVLNRVSDLDTTGNFAKEAKFWRNLETWKSNGGPQDLMNFGISAGSNFMANTQNGGMTGGNLMRAGAGVAAMIPGYGAPIAVGMNIIGAGLDRRDENLGVYEQAKSGFVDRRRLREAAQEKLGMNFVDRGLANVFGETSSQKYYTDLELKKYDERTVTRLEHSRQGGALGNYNRQMDSIDDWAASMKDKLSPDVLDHHRKALEADAEAAYKAAKGMEELDKAANAFGAFSKTSALREQLGLGKQTPQDVAKALSMSGSGVSIGAVSGADNQKKVLQALEGLLYTQALGQGGFDANASKMRTTATASAGQAYDILKGLGVDTQGKNTDQLITLIQSILVPAMQGLADAGLGATKNIGMLNTDNPGELKFDAPEMGVTTIQQSNTWYIDGNVIGNQSAFEDLARRMGITLATQSDTVA